MLGGYRDLPRHRRKYNRLTGKLSFGVPKTYPLRSASPFAAPLRHREIQCAANLSGAPRDPGAWKMPDPNAGLPPRYLRTSEAARFLSLSGRTLEKHRTYGTGPAYRKLGGRVVYALEDLKAWADRGAKTSTSDPGAATVLPAKRHAALRPYAGKGRR
jgi:hypothetical protein